MEDIISSSISFFDSLVNVVPSPYYIASEESRAVEAAAELTDFADQENKKKKSSQMKRKRYDARNWCTTITAIFQRSTLSTGRVKRHVVSANKKFGNSHHQGAVPPAGSKHADSTGCVSREELRRRLHEKIAALQLQKQQNQKKGRKSVDESDMTATARKRHRPSDASSKPSAVSKNHSLLNGQTETKVTSTAKSSPPPADVDFMYGSVAVAGAAKMTGQHLPRPKKMKLADALRKIEETKEVRADWSEEQKAAAEMIEQRESALTRAAGGKVYDDQKRLKKALHARARKTAKSKEMWASRTESVAEGKKEKAAKRQKNIEERLQKIKAKK